MKKGKRRTKEEIAQDLSKILCMDLHYGTKHSVLHGAVWAWTEMDGKIKGCKYWSKRAIESKDNKNLLTHEHVVPRNILISKLIELINPKKEEILEILSKYCIGVVLTREENKFLDSQGLKTKMPEGWDWGSPWARYEISKLKDEIQGA